MQGVTFYTLYSIPYFVFLDARCDKALAAAVFDFVLVRPSRNTAEAADAALLDVCFEFFINYYLLFDIIQQRKP